MPFDAATQRAIQAELRQLVVDTLKRHNDKMSQQVLDELREKIVALVKRHAEQLPSADGAEGTTGGQGPQTSGDP